MGLKKLAFGVRCLRCGHKQTVLPHSLIHLGIAYPIDGIPARFVCSRCGARGKQVTAEYLWR